MICNIQGCSREAIQKTGELVFCLHHAWVLGLIKSDKKIECSKCHGKGKEFIYTTLGKYTMITCRTCGGKGFRRFKIEMS